mmetsp:Transcript_165462/g.525935  ORF Transcript_165462/g.525935 Transcript_165462/m.525935 type:complete len:735 (-) Transcript_165462:136-2340(-)
MSVQVAPYAGATGGATGGAAAGTSSTAASAGGGGGAAGADPEAASEDRRQPWLYHERQVGAMCALHCLNNLLQGPYFDETGLREVTKELDQQEQALTEGLGLDEGNARTDGYFNVQVMQVLLARLGLEMELFRNPSSWATEGVDPSEEVAFILNRRMHWFTALKVRGQWFDLNSRLRHPQRYELQDLRDQMSGFMSEGWTVFVVRGDFSALWGEARPLPAAVEAGRRAFGPAQASMRRRCFSNLKTFTRHWFDHARFEPEPPWPPPEAVSSGSKAAAPSAGQPEEDPHGEGPAKVSAAWADSGGPAPPVTSSAGAPPSQAPPQLGRGFGDPHYDAFFRVDDRSYESDGVASGVASCLRGHELHPLGRTRDNGWSCDGMRFKGGCVTGLTGKNQSFGVNRFRCELCDYDVCEQCYFRCCDGTPELQPVRPKRNVPSHPPVFVIIQGFVVAVLWTVCALRPTYISKVADPLTDRSGLEGLVEGSVISGMTSFLIHRDCDDLRSQVWRWYSHQFTHETLGQVLTAVLFTLVLGLPLEVYHNCLVICLVFNMGILGGAAFHGLFHAHGDLVGMMAGCLALVGMHLADLILNFRHSRLRWPKLAAILACSLPLLQPWPWERGRGGWPGLASHAGGLLMGLLLGLTFGRSLLGKRPRRVVKVTALTLALCVLVLAAAWVGTQWPPRDIGSDEEPWCWSRVVSTRDPVAPSGVRQECVRPMPEQRRYRVIVLGGVRSCRVE